LQNILIGYSRDLAAKYGDQQDLQPEVSKVYLSLGLLVAREKGNDQALEYFLKAKEICKKLVAQFPDSEDTPSYQGRLARCCLELGAIYAERGKKHWEDADRNYDEARSLFEKLPGDRRVKNSSSLQYYERYWAETLHKQAELLDSKKQYREAVKRYLESIDIRNGLVHEDGKSPKFRRDLARGHGYLGDVYAELGEWAAAHKAYAEADRIRKTLYEESGEEADPKWQLARSYTNTARLLRTQGRPPEEVLKLVEKPTEMFGDLVKAHPTIKDYQEDLAANLNLVGALRLETVPADNDAAAHDLERAREIYEKLRRLDPNAVSYLDGQAWSRAYLGKLYVDTQPERARDFLGRALTAFKNLSGQRQPAVEDYYNFALVQALSAELVARGKARLTPDEQRQQEQLIEDALKNIEKLVEESRSSYMSVARLRNERGLKILRDRKKDAFSKLLGVLETINQGREPPPD
jgi:hypothetical protein